MLLHLAPATQIILRSFKDKTQRLQQKRARMVTWDPQPNRWRVRYRSGPQRYVIIRATQQTRLKMPSRAASFKQSTWWRKCYKETWAWEKRFRNNLSWLTNRIVKFSNFKMKTKIWENVCKSWRNLLEKTLILNLQNLWGTRKSWSNEWSNWRRRAIIGCRGKPNAWAPRIQAREPTKLRCQWKGNTLSPRLQIEITSQYGQRCSIQVASQLTLLKRPSKIMMIRLRLYRRTLDKSLESELWQRSLTQSI